jgi:hypothetical protein
MVVRFSMWHGAILPTMRCAAAVFVIVASGLAVAQSSTVAPKQTSKDPAQPIAFNHKLHSARGLECSSCHDNPDPGETMSMPTTDLCMACHQTVATEKTSIKRLRHFATGKQPIPWVRIYSLPGFVFWSHRTHLAAGQSCDACHGDIANMPVVHATNVTTMDGCVACHTKKDANTGCSGCHEGQSS